MRVAVTDLLQLLGIKENMSVILALLVITNKKVQNTITIIR